MTPIRGRRNSMKINMIASKILAGFAISSMVIAPMVSSASLVEPLNPTKQSQESKRRQKTKNDWRNLATGSGVLAILGLLSKDSTLVFAGTAGALYSAYRYEQDRKSQSKMDRARASMFSKSSFTRNGKKYKKRTVMKNGKKYYQFVRA